MPIVRKLAAEEVRTLENKGKGQRKLTEEQYDQFLADYTEGDHGEAELEEEENRLTVRNRFKAAATRRGIVLNFMRTKGNVLRFKVVSGNGQVPEQTEATKPEPATAKNGRGRRRKT